MPDSPLFVVSYGALWLLVAVQTFVLLRLVRSGTRAGQVTTAATRPETAPEPLPAGSPAPEFTAPRLGGGDPFDSARLRGAKALLSFVSPDCFVCAGSVPTMRKVADLAEAVLVLVCAGPADRCQDFVASHAPGTTALGDPGGQLARRFRAGKTPTAVLLDEQGRILQYGTPAGSDGRWTFRTPPARQPAA